MIGRLDDPRIGSGPDGYSLPVTSLIDLLARLGSARDDTGSSALYVLYVIIAILVIIFLLRILGIA